MANVEDPNIYVNNYFVFTVVLLEKNKVKIPRECTDTLHFLGPFFMFSE